MKIDDQRATRPVALSFINEIESFKLLIIIQEIYSYNG
jgi:hypothetical protein